MYRRENKRAIVANSMKFDHAFGFQPCSHRHTRSVRVDLSTYRSIVPSFGAFEIITA